MHALKAVAVADIKLSKTNPRAGINQERLKELAESIRNVGVLEPVLIRPLASKNGASYELVCGERRLRAAQLAELEEIPAIVRELTDEQALEIQVIENLQRDDLHPLDEAEGYRQLMAKGKYDVARLAERVGRSVKYIYDRVKLLQLSAEAKEYFLEGFIQAGHAILLARLKPKDQDRALDLEKGGVFETEDLLWSPEHGGRYGRNGDKKARSVRELQGWIDEHVRFDQKAPDVPDLFPETARAIASAEDGERKIIPITYDNFIQQDAKDKQRIYGPRSWKRADGKEGRDDFGRKFKSKTCDRSGLGVFMVGPGRGGSLEVCVNRSCAVHFPETAKAKKKRAAKAVEGADRGTSREKAWADQEARRKDLERKQDERWQRFAKARPKVMEALALAVGKASVGAGGPLAKLLVSALSWGLAPASVFPAGRGGDDLVRHLAFRIITKQAGHRFSLDGFAATARSLGVDVGKLVKEHAPPKKAAGAASKRPKKTAGVRS
jgi:ParB/RepB/Spo0J family partition protein